MPSQLAEFPWTGLYPLIGIYRLLHDPLLYKPIWLDCRRLGSQAVLGAIVWAFIAFPWNKWVARTFMSSTHRYLASYADASFLRISLSTYAGLILSLTQASFIVERTLRARLRKARQRVFDQVVISRAKGPDFWTEYVEELEHPPTAQARKNAKKQAFLFKLVSPVFFWVLRKAIYVPFAFFPIVGLVINSYFSAISTARTLHRPFFKAKGMTALEEEIWIIEHQWDYRAFGFVAAMLEHLPVVGMVFGVGNRAGGAMLAFDYEKKQQRIRQEHALKALKKD